MLKTGPTPSKPENPKAEEKKNKCYYPSLNYSIRDKIKYVRSDSDDEECQQCCYPCTTPMPYVDSAPIIDVTCIPIVWVLGASSSVTNVACKRMLVDIYCLVHISVKDMLNEELTTGSQRAVVIKMMMDKGAQVPSELVLEMIREKMMATRDTAAGYLIEGYPREGRQAIAFEKAISSPSTIIYLEFTEEAFIRHVQQKQESNEEQKNNRCCCSKSTSENNTEKYTSYYKNFVKYNEEILKQYWTKVHHINADQKDNEICCQVLFILNPIIAQALRYKNKEMILKTLLKGQSTVRT